MKKKLLFLTLLFALVGCGSNNLTYKNIDVDSYINASKNEAALSAFSLDNPLNDAIVDTVTHFSWNASTNAESYTLEICSSDQFISNIETIDYYRRDNIISTSFDINSNFAFKEQMYYWRVTAKNSGGTKVCDVPYHFYVKAPAVEEVDFDLGETDDWLLHPLGSYADVTVNDSSFFGENQKTLRIAFKEEYTNRGVAESDGWIVVTHTTEKSIYGTDALFFNCFYAGQDASIIIRLVDRDNEYWYCPIQVSNNAKQSVILKFSDFVQRTGDVTVANQKFDYERIKYMEVVFERTFGDGVFLISGVKAIKFNNYREYFIEKLNFNDYSSDLYVKDTYEFDYEIHDDYELEMSYYGTNDMGKPKINGYGFLKINVNRYMFSGNAIKLSVKYTGSVGRNVLLRVYEEDTDRWSFKIPFNALEEGEYKTLVIPYSAFAKSETLGDGRRQFYFILNLQFGLEGQNGTGKLFFKDFEVVDINSEEYKRETAREVTSDGLIENFDTYDFNSDAYFIWTQSAGNKDEYIGLNNTANAGSNNKYCGQFEYKSDMERALYYLPVKCDEQFSSLSLWLRDASIKSGDERVATIENYSPEVGIYVRLLTGEIYLYTIPSLARAWYEYDIPFDAFELTNDAELKVPAKPIQSSTISHVGISMRFLYINNKGVHIPVYSISNPVLVDNIYFTNYDSYRVVAKDRIVTMDEDTKQAVVDDFETYMNDSEMLDIWGDGRDYEYQAKSLSTDVSSEGGKYSLKLQYLTKDNSPSYFIAPAIDSSVSCRTIKFDIKSELSSTVYLNIYTRTGTTEKQYRVTLNNVTDKWTEYVIGFGRILDITDQEQSFNLNYLPLISRISFGVVSYAGQEKELSNIYIDNLKFDANYTKYSTYEVRVIDE